MRPGRGRGRRKQKTDCAEGGGKNLVGIGIAAAQLGREGVGVAVQHEPGEVEAFGRLVESAHAAERRDALVTPPVREENGIHLFDEDVLGQRARGGLAPKRLLAKVHGTGRRNHFERPFASPNLRRFPVRGRRDGGVGALAHFSIARGAEHRQLVRLVGRMGTEGANAIHHVPRDDRRRTRDPSVVVGQDGSCLVTEVDAIRRGIAHDPKRAIVAREAKLEGAESHAAVDANR